MSFCFALVAKAQEEKKEKKKRKKKARKRIINFILFYLDWGILCKLRVHTYISGRIELWLLFSSTYRIWTSSLNMFHSNYLYWTSLWKRRYLLHQLWNCTNIIPGVDIQCECLIIALFFFLFFFRGTSPWCNRSGWLGVKHQLTLEEPEIHTGIQSFWCCCFLCTSRWIEEGVSYLWYEDEASTAIRVCDMSPAPHLTAPHGLSVSASLLGLLLWAILSAGELLPFWLLLLLLLF